MTRIAIMQPYFVPYAGYFRLFAATDVFVVYDCVQFIRRGWIHRNRLTTQQGELDWLTLPLQKAPQDVLIKDLAFSSDKDERWEEQKRRFPVFKKKHPFLKKIENLSGTPLEFIESTLKETCATLDISYNVIRSSSLAIPESVKAQERILAICEALKATHYLNAPGGKELYDDAAFKKRNINLEFLSDYEGPYTSILERIVNEGAEAVEKEIKSQC